MPCGKGTNMSYYYSYFIGAKDTETGKIRVLGPYSRDKEGKLKVIPVLCKSSSFASDLYDNFRYIDESDLTAETVDAFSYTSYDGKKEMSKLKGLLYFNLPRKEFIKTKYVLTSELMNFLGGANRDYNEEEFFTDTLNVESYAVLAQSFLSNGSGIEEEVFDEDEGVTTRMKKPEQYTMYRYVDYNSPEFEAWLIAEAVDHGEYEFALNKSEVLIILETEG